MNKLFLLPVIFMALMYICTSCNKNIESANDGNIIKEKAAPMIQNEEAIPGIRILCCDIARKKYDCYYGGGLCNCRFFPNCNGNAALLDTYLYEKNSKMIISSSDNFGGEVKDILFIDEDLPMPKEFAEEMGYNEIIVLKGEYKTVKLNKGSERTNVLVNVNLIK